jgi:hypothetical protein
LERYIKDDVVRYGGRLGDLEKKLVGAYHDMVSATASLFKAFPHLIMYLRLLWRFRARRACSTTERKLIISHRASKKTLSL